MRLLLHVVSAHVKFVNILPDSQVHLAALDNTLLLLRLPHQHSKVYVICLELPFESLGEL